MIHPTTPHLWQAIFAALLFAADVPIDILVQRERSEGDGAANWLPSAEGPFWVIMRMYVPAEKALKGDDTPPVVERVDG